MRNKVSLSRRQLLILASSSIVAAPLAALGAGYAPDIHVVKNPQCGCCTAWIKILTDKGFNVTTEDRSGSVLTEFKIESSIPRDMMSCHTAKIDGYFITAVPLTFISTSSDRYSFDHHVEGHLAAKPSSLVSQINSAATGVTSVACF